MLQPEHCIRIEEVRWPFAAPLVFAANAESLVNDSCAILRIRRSVPCSVLGGNDLDADPTEQARGAGKILVDELVAQADCLERLCASV